MRPSSLEGDPDGRSMGAYRIVLHTVSFSSSFDSTLKKE